VRFDVAFLPTEVHDPAGAVCIVIDALRATSTLATLFGRGVTVVHVAGSIEDARELYAGLPESLLCGESGGLPPAGFDYGNSPVEFEGLDVAGRTVVLATSNGTRALASLAGAHAVFTGSLLNLTAAARAALDVAKRDRIKRVIAVCAGNELGTIFSLEDTYVAGAFIERLVRLADDPDALARLADRATAAYRLWRAYSSPRLAVGEAVHGQALARLGLSADLDACARVDIYPVAPRLTHTPTGGLLLTDGD
jgi:2-phosphosulfolactate phosphatase